MIDTWNPAVLNETTQAIDSWNPAELNQVTTKVDSWNPAILNKNLESTTPVVFSAIITASFPEGATCTATDGTTTLTADDNPMAFSIPNKGTWAVACVANGVTFSENVVITTNGQTETVDLTPVGSTYATTDSVPVLIACAGIGDSEITTIAGALADVETLTAILESENAVDYLVRSTTFASDVTADSVAMTGIGAINYDADTLLADSTWKTAICNSAYFESVLNVKAPKMTSNNTPSGVCSASSVISVDHSAYHAFDGSNTTFWESQGVATEGSSWVEYSFDDNINIYLCKITCYKDNNSGTLTYNVKGSDDGFTTETTLVDQVTIQAADYSDLQVLSHIINGYKGNSFRLTGSGGSYQGSYYTLIRELQFYGRVDV